jgi:hypothetical protein
LDAVFSWTWISTPTTTSYRVDDAAGAVTPVCR